MAELRAIIFDCDGVLAETERDGHRVAFNRAFAQAGLEIEWSVEEYRELVRVAGGKERIRHYLAAHPQRRAGRVIDDDFIGELHKNKTAIYSGMGRAGLLPAREGVARILDEAIGQGLRLFVCSTSNRVGVVSLIASLYGEQRLSRFTEIYAGDVVANKKPAPDIYNLVKDNHGLRGEECVVIEDSRNGLVAAKRAGMRCVVTVSFYSYGEDFSEADLVVSSLGGPGLAPVRGLSAPARLPKGYVTVSHLRGLVR